MRKFLVLNSSKQRLNARNSFVSAFEQKIYNSLNKDLVSKYFLVIFTLSFIHSFWVENDYKVNQTKL